MSDFPTNKDPILLNTAFEEIELQAVQCFREGLGFTKLAHVHGEFATWCLIVADEFVEMIRDMFDFDALLMEVV